MGTRNGMLKVVNRELSVAGFVLSPTGLVASNGLAFEQWQQAGAWLRQAEGAIHWWIGDWLNYGERHYGEKYTQALEQTDFEYQTLADDKWVAGTIEFSRRRENLPFSHHREVAPLEPELQEQLLAEAEPEPGSDRPRLTRRELRQRVAQVRQHQAAKLAGEVEPQKYRCVVIDPPWPVEKIEREARPNQGRELDYPVMTLEQIDAFAGAKLKRAALHEGCHVYLWVTQKFLPAGLQLFESWGVQYQCMLTWVKPTGMTPYSWMYNTEHILFGRIGSLPLEEMGLKLSFDAAVSRHSAKPEVFYERVRKASPGPRLSLFEREDKDGFKAWGNEVGNG